MTDVDTEDRSADKTKLSTEMDAVANRLHAEFDEKVGPDTVTTRLAETADRFRAAKVLTFVPVLAERYTRSALRGV